MSFTGNVTCVIGKGFAGKLGRKGTASDVTLYNNKTGDCVLSFVEPSSYPEKIQSLVSALNLADQVLFKIDNVDSFFAETLVCLDAFAICPGYLVLPENVSLSDLMPLIKGTVLEDYSVVEDQIMALRETLAGLEGDTESDVLVQVDHSFTVRGVGTVALGVVKKGIIRKYDEIKIQPGDTTSAVKSMQVHDVDVDHASAGARVGLALKNIKPEDIPRGSMVSKKGNILMSDNLSVEFHLSKYSSRKISEGDIFLVNSALNYVPAKVTEGSVSPGGVERLTLNLEKKIPLPNERVIALDPGQKPPRAFGYGIVKK